MATAGLGTTKDSGLAVMVTERTRPASCGLAAAGKSVAASVLWVLRCPQVASRTPSLGFQGSCEFPGYEIPPIRRLSGPKDRESGNGGRSRLRGWVLAGTRAPGPPPPSGWGTASLWGTQASPSELPGTQPPVPSRRGADNVSTYDLL